MFKDKSSKFDTDNENLSFNRDFPELFKMDSDSAAEPEELPTRSFSNFEYLKQNENHVETGSLTNQTNQQEDSAKTGQVWPDPTEFSGNSSLKQAVNKQMKPRAVNKIAKEMKKCSKNYFARVFGKQRKNVLFVAKQVSVSPRNCPAQSVVGSSSVRGRLQKRV